MGTVTSWLAHHRDSPSLAKVMTVYLIPQDHLPALRASPVSFSSLSGVRKVWERLWDLEIAPWKHVFNEERLRHNWHGFDLNSDPQGFIQTKKWCWNHSLGLCLLGLIFLSTRYFCPCFSANNTGQIISFDWCFEGFWAFFVQQNVVGRRVLSLALTAPPQMQNKCPGFRCPPPWKEPLGTWYPGVSV